MTIKMLQELGVCDADGKPRTLKKGDVLDRAELVGLGCDVDDLIQHGWMVDAAASEAPPVLTPASGGQEAPADAVVEGNDDEDESGGED